MDNKSPKNISRRDTIKILTAAIGAGVLANIPSKWTKPGMEFGVLPAHAQGSVPLHTLAAGADDPQANFCQPLTSTIAITPPTEGIVLRYNIVTGGIGTIISPNPPSGTLPTDAAGMASLGITVDNMALNIGDTVIVTWSFEDPADGSGSDDQVFTNASGGC